MDELESMVEKIYRLVDQAHIAKGKIDFYSGLINKYLKRMIWHGVGYLSGYHNRIAKTVLPKLEEMGSKEQASFQEAINWKGSSWTGHCSITTFLANPEKYQQQGLNIPPWQLRKIARYFTLSTLEILGLTDWEKYDKLWSQPEEIFEIPRNCQNMEDRILYFLEEEFTWMALPLRRSMYHPSIFTPVTTPLPEEDE